MSLPSLLFLQLFLLLLLSSLFRLSSSLFACLFLLLLLLSPLPRPLSAFFSFRCLHRNTWGSRDPPGLWKQFTVRPTRLVDSGMESPEDPFRVDIGAKWCSAKAWLWKPVAVSHCSFRCCTPGASYKSSAVEGLVGAMYWKG